MEGVSVHVYKGLRKYWNRRRGYVRLNNKHGRKNQTEQDPVRKRRRFWRVKLSPRIRLWMRAGSPKKWLTRLRDAYVNMMLKISNSGFVGGAAGFGGSVQYGFGNCQVNKEYDEKMIVQFYKSFVIAQAQLAPRGGNENRSSVSFSVVGIDDNNDNKASDKHSGSQNRISILTR